MTDQSIKRIGFCCKYMDPDQTQKPKILKEIQQNFTEKGTTVAWCNRQEKADAEDKLLEVVTHNMKSAYNLVEYVSTLPENRRMVRLGSNQIPMATEPTWRYVFEDATVIKELEKGFARVGQLARDKDVRVSFHPGQFCVLASDKPEVVERSIDEFEYHANMVRWMGFGKSFQDGCKINVHISGRQGPEGIKKALPRLSQEARNLITIENDEMGHGLEKSLELEKDLALVLDIHHHWIRDEEYIEPTDDRVKRVIDSWRGQRPSMHYSYSRDEHLAVAGLGDKTHTDMHNIKDLLERGCKKQKPRAHSDLLPNTKVNDWALSFSENFDIQVEAKGKNMATEQLYRQAKETAVI